jgi:hypothetical protein
MIDGAVAGAAHRQQAHGNVVSGEIDLTPPLRLRLSTQLFGTRSHR